MSLARSADEIRQQMAQVRADLQRNTERLAHDAQRLTDWRYHVRRHPWLALGAAGVVGFLLIPRRAKPVSLDPETVARLAEQQRLTPSSNGADSSSLLGSLANTAARALLRAGLSYLGQYVGQIVGAAVAARTTPGQRERDDRTRVGGEPR